MFEMEDGYASIGLFMNIQSQEKFFRSHSSLNFTLDNCKSLDLCPSQLTQGGFIDYVSSLDKYSVFKSLIEKNKMQLDEAFNTTGHTFSISKNRVYGDDVFPRQFHYNDKVKLIIVVPVFTICLITCLIVYYRKRKLLTKYNFKFSNLSKVLVKYLMAKLFFTIFYLIFLVLFGDFKFKSLGSTGILITMSVINYTFSLLTFYLVALFAFGYCTAFYSLKNNGYIALKCLMLVLLYGIQTIPHLITQLNQIKSNFYNKFFMEFDSISITAGSIILFFTIIGILLYVANNTYTKLLDKDYRYLISCITITVGYLINPFIVVPKGRRNMLMFFRQKFFSSTEFWDMGHSSGVHVPEIIELIVITVLIYIWRDQKFVETSEKKYSVLS